ncbi:hypothetical protein NH26_01515 [Flammeovirga pacifica]|uniref:Wadjet protein JetD C-terminal domain-containing protein n=2 Tax=Flammeovirga pacifica TaxID=915059 RepID=A0A1S1YW67_FLAPC|nr:hypothetical protein NH26_01515 [Flammeovirga pacifica]
MNDVTFEDFFEGDTGTPSKIDSLPNLTLEEEKLYRKVRSNNYRLEREKIPNDHVIKILSKKQ